MACFLATYVMGEHVTGGRETGPRPFSQPYNSQENYMLIKILKGGNFAHPDPKRYGEDFWTKDGEIVDVDEAMAEFIIGLDRGEPYEPEEAEEEEVTVSRSNIQKEVEVVEPTEKDVPEIETQDSQRQRKPRRKAGRKPGTSSED